MINYNYDNKMVIKFIDLFAGLGGFRIALEKIAKKKRIKTKCVLVAEIDKHVIETYKANFGKNEKILDIKNIDSHCSQVPNHNFLFAGFPCQCFSNAGKKQGFLDEIRGKLFFDIVKILRQKKPKYFILENVKYLVNHENGETWKIIMNELDKLGYAVPKKPLILSPHMLNIPQERYRVFIPGILRSKMKKPTKYLDFNFSKYFKIYNHTRKTIEENFLDKNVESKYFLNPKNTNDKYLINVFKAWEEFVKNVKFPKNMTLPVIWLNQMINPIFSKSNPKWKNDYLIKMNSFYKSNKFFIDKWMKKHKTYLWKLREQKFEWQMGKENNDIKQAIITLRQSGIRCKKFKKFPTLVAIVQTTLIFDHFKKQWRHLTPRECARLQSFPEKYKLYNEINSKKNSNYYSYKQLGNSLNLDIVSIVERELLDYV